MLGRQWEDRLRIWAEQLEKRYVRWVAEVDTAWCTSFDHLTPEEAARRTFRPAPVGLRWGAKWEYGWFRACFTVPEALDGERLVVSLGASEEMLVWVNGREAGSLDKKHRQLTLSRAARAGETYHILAECYAGHGVRNEGAGPVGVGEEPVPEVTGPQQTVAPSRVGVWNEALFQAAMDYLTLYSLVRQLPERSLRAQRIYDGLKRFTCVADFELPEPALTESVTAAARELAPLLACRNGSTAPEFTVFGQSHLDLAWLWPEAETVRKAARTYANQLALMEEYPEYRFLMCEPPLVEHLRAHYPSLHARVMERVRSGAFLPEGAMWVECDTNIPSGESLIRQFVLGKRWFRRETGTDSRLAWMPDTFGFSAALPQIMRGCQVDCFATQKLTRQDPEAEPFPYNLFWWEGLDGTRVLAHVFRKNNAVFQPGETVVRWERDRVQEEHLDGLLFPFGYGDGGGGPTREMLEMARRCADLEGAPRCRMESPLRFFDRARERGVAEVYRGELYLAWHRGTLTAQAETKRGIRRAEGLLRAVEYHLARRLLRGGEMPEGWRERVDGWWKRLLAQQFHDVAAGACIRRVHEEAEQALEEVASGCGEMLRELLGEGGGEQAVYNPSGWGRTYRGQTVPAQGARVIGAGAACPETATLRQVSGGAGETLWELRNAHLTCRVDALGQVVSLRCAGSDRELMAGPGNRLLLFKDVNTCYDAWELGSMYERMPVEMPQQAETVTGADAEGVWVEVTRRFGASRLRQRVLLAHDGRRIDFITGVDWHERHRLLKAAFPLNVCADEAVHEIQFGNLRRSTHPSRQHDRDQYEVCCQRYSALEDGGAGAAVLNDGRYGISARGSELRLSLLRAPMMPDMQADQGHHEFTYALYPFTGPLADSDVLREATDLNEPLQTGDPSRMADAGPVLRCDSAGVVVDALRPADTVPGAATVRVWEAMGRQTRAVFEVGEDIRQIVETDMLEERPRPLDWRPGEKLTLTLRGYEIKTFLLMTKERERDAGAL